MLTCNGKLAIMTNRTVLNSKKRYEFVKHFLLSSYNLSLVIPTLCVIVIFAKGYHFIVCLYKTQYGFLKLLS